MLLIIKMNSKENNKCLYLLGKKPREKEKQKK